MIIGICGDISSGKDTVGDVLVADFGFRRASFAEPLKEWVFQLVEPLGVERRHLFGTQEDKAEPLKMLAPFLEGTESLIYWTGRGLLERLGTDVGREIHPDVWVQRLVQEYQKAVRDQKLRHEFEPSAFVREVRKNTEHAERVVVTDVRFKNEFDAIRELGGQIWRTFLRADHPEGCEARDDARRACTCGVIEATGHVSDVEWRFEEYDRMLCALKPGVDVLQRQAREFMKETQEVLGS